MLIALLLYLSTNRLSLLVFFPNLARRFWVLTYLPGVVVRHKHLARRVEPVVNHLPKRQVRNLSKGWRCSRMARKNKHSMGMGVGMGMVGVEVWAEVWG